MIASLSCVLSCVALAAASPVVWPRTVSSLNEPAVAEAQQRDNTATRAFSNVEITTSDGQCLFVDPLSGDFRENLTPIQVAACGSTAGQGWDVITAGIHNNVKGSMLIVSTLTEACFNFDPRRAAGNQVLLFSCGGRADGSGQVTNSQLFPFNGTAGPLAFEPENSPGSCLTVKGNVLDVANCNTADQSQFFTFGGTPSTDASATAASSAAQTTADSTSSAASAASTTAAASQAADASGDDEDTSSCSVSIRTVTVTVPGEITQQTAAAAAASSTADASSSADAAATSFVSALNIPNPTTPVPVSRAGGTLQPSAAAEANERDDAATRAFTSAEIRAPNGQCLFIDPTAGDFRENLIPVALVDCAGTPNEKWDIITAGKHNDQPGSALIVSSLTNGCISLDDRRAAGDTVTLFSCGGRGDGTGQTNSGQLIPFDGALSFVMAPESDNNKTCIVPGDGRLISQPCGDVETELFSIFP